MSVLTSNYGLPPANAQLENTGAILWDTIMYAVDTVPAEEDLFSSAKNKNKRYRSGLLADLANQKNIKIIGMRADMYMEFTARGSEDVAVTQKIFEDFSQIKIVTNDKIYDPIPLSNLLPYSTGRSGVAETLLAISPVYIFADPILVPRGGNITFTFNPVAFETAAAGAAYVALPEVTDSSVFYIKFTFFGRQERVTA